MAPASPSLDVLDFVTRVARAYAKLIASPHVDPESGLGGSLFYVGEMDEQCRALVVAANIAGAATLVASADPAVQKQAIRDAIADFLVTSLDEALRVLKNQLRKRETVSVCVSMAPRAMEREMNERGVQPDLLRSVVDSATRTEIASPGLLIWSVTSAPARWLPKLDAIALESLDADAWAARRWLRLAPRYMGRLTHGIRSLACNQEVSSRFKKHVQQSVDRGEICVPVEIRRRNTNGLEEKYCFEPGERRVP